MKEKNGNYGNDSVRPHVRVRAAVYVRMSTDHQKYSTENQEKAIRLYAEEREIDIVRTYSDAGKSGLRIDGRDALKNLIEDVKSGQAEFDTILVYDISRWGRFQDADESAYYEYICKRSGITVQYCAEQFENDGSPVATIVKGVKRAMAGEYSRELSTKVFAGQSHLVELGFRQGGIPGYGLRRALIDQHGNLKGELSHGEHKSIHTDRVILITGPENEVSTIREIYHRFVNEHTPERKISEDLNTRGVFRENGHPWTRGTIHQILINEKYIGNNVWNRTSFKLKKKRVRNTQEMWIRADGAFPAIIDHQIFNDAQTIIQERSFRMSNEAMLDALRELRRSNGILSGLIIDEADQLPSSSTYRYRFGSLLRAYELVGYTPPRDYRYIEINQMLRSLHPEVVSKIINELSDLGCQLYTSPDTNLISVNGELTISVVIARCRRTPGGSYRWHIRFDTGLHPDVTIAIRMDITNKSPLDYYLLPKIDIATEKLRIAEENDLSIDGYQFESLDPLYKIIKPHSIEEAA